MAKTKSKGKSNKTGKNQPQRKKSQTPRPQRMGGLDQGAMHHIRLMADPCNAPLVHPAYESPGGGAVIRYRKFITVGTAGVEKCGAFSWAPALNEHFANGADASANAFAPARVSTFPDLAATSASTAGSSFRCVAACARIITNASELNRAGLVYAGATDMNQAWGAGAAVLNVDSLAGILPVTTRSPNKSIEIVWTPGGADTDFNSDDTLSVTGRGAIGRNTLTFAFAGAPSAIGYTIELTGVYEVKFGAGTGVCTSITPPPSSNSWNQVLRGFAQAIRNAPVVIDGVRRATDFVANAGTAYMGQLGSRAAVGLLM